MDDEKKTRGRPKKSDSREHFVRVRLTEEEYEALERMRLTKGETRSQFLRKALRAQRNLYDYMLENPDFEGLDG